ncbi:MAG: NAD(P)H-hydrate dehydratase [Bacteroidia bacterium]|nr:NAD(P)H-hydrate dehydratase [Bacteroidia bacterium]
MKKLTKSIIRGILKTRKPNSHKGDFGHALIIAGSKSKMGAGIIASKACIRAGVGMLSVNIPEQERLALQVSIPEAMSVFRGDTIKDSFNYSALAIGPGIGTQKDAVNILKHIINTFTNPILLDADALNIIADNNELLKKLPKETILTPHPKEFDRLFGKHENDNERMLSAVSIAKKYNIIIVLKGHQTLVTYNDDSYINKTGNAGLAKAGSGDALSGIITAFLAQGYLPINAALLGVYIHGLTADLTLKNQSMESMLITDIVSNLGKAFLYLKK